jgi:hypothetical protein
MKRVSLSRLEVRLRGIAPSTAQAAAAGLGRELVRQLGTWAEGDEARGALEVASIDLGTIRVSPGAGATDICRLMGQATAGAIAEKTRK